MQISVVIPARNAAKTIGEALQTILEADLHPDEILVVDGCSSDNTASIAQHYGAYVITNHKLHVAAARQLGTMKARNEVIAFTDSDCLPARDWLLRIATHFQEDSELAGVGGRVELTNPRNEIQAYGAHVFESIMRFPDQKVLITQKGMSGSFAGANCAYRKETILAIGGFRDFFSNHAEEIDLFWRLTEFGAKLLFDPQISVEHLEYPDTLRRLVRTNFNYGIASTKLAKHHIGRQVDVHLYRILLSSLLSMANPFYSERWAHLQSMQVASFIAGKLYGSIRFRTVNI